MVSKKADDNKDLFLLFRSTVEDLDVVVLVHKDYKEREEGIDIRNVLIV